MRQEPVISVIIPHVFGNVLLSCLRSLTETCRQFPIEVLVVSDGDNKDPSLLAAKEEFPFVRFLATGGGKGYGASCNLGGRIARGEFIAFLNNDLVVTPNWLGPLLEQLQSNPLVGACQPKSLSAHDQKHFDWGGAGGEIDIFGYPFVWGRLFDHMEEDIGQYSKVREIFWAFGGALVVKKKIFESIGGFDPVFFLQMEEIDLCWRIRLAGFKVMYIPDSTVYHYGGYTLPNGSWMKIHLNHRNNLRLLIKNYSLSTLLVILPLRLVFECMSAFYFLARMEFRSFSALVWGWGWILLTVREMLSTRTISQSMRIISDKEIFKAMFKRSLVIDRFLLRKTAKDLLHDAPLGTLGC